MITLQEAEKIHRILIEKFGGAGGVRDMRGLDSALKRPYATFGKKELYPTPIEKAAAIIESIIINHPFLDGNKRLGYVLMRLLLLEQHYDIIASNSEKYSFVLSISEGELSFEDICTWIQKHIMED